MDRTITEESDSTGFVTTGSSIGSATSEESLSELQKMDRTTTEESDSTGFVTTGSSIGSATSEESLSELLSSFENLPWQLVPKHTSTPRKSAPTPVVGQHETYGVFSWARGGESDGKRMGAVGSTVTLGLDSGEFVSFEITNGGISNGNIEKVRYNGNEFYREATMEYDNSSRREMIYCYPNGLQFLSKSSSERISIANHTGYDLVYKTSSTHEDRFSVEPQCAFLKDGQLKELQVYAVDGWPGSETLFIHWIQCNMEDSANTLKGPRRCFEDSHDNPTRGTTTVPIETISE